MRAAQFSKLAGQFAAQSRSCPSCAASASVGSSGDHRYNGGRLAFRKPLPLHELSVYKRSVGFAKLLTKEMQRHSSISATCMQVVGVCAKTTAKHSPGIAVYTLWPLDRVGVGVDAKKGNHRPRRMGHDGSLGNCTSRARAASPEAPTAHSNGRYQETFGCRLPAWDRQPASRPGKVQAVSRS